MNGLSKQDASYLFISYNFQKKSATTRIVAHITALIAFLIRALLEKVNCLFLFLAHTCYPVEGGDRLISGCAPAH